MDNFLAQQQNGSFSEDFFSVGKFHLQDIDISSLGECLVFVRAVPTCTGIAAFKDQTAIAVKHHQAVFLWIAKLQVRSEFGVVGSAGGKYIGDIYAGSLIETYGVGSELQGFLTDVGQIQDQCCQQVLAC